MSIDIQQAFTQQPEPLDYVLPGMLAGTVGSIVSPGGAGKTTFLLQLAVQLAGGVDTLGVGELVQGRVYYLAAEDPGLALVHRLHAIGRLIPPSRWEALKDNLIIEPLVGESANIMSPEWRDFLCAAADGSRLIILDTLRRFHSLDENSSGDMSRLLSTLEHVTSLTGCSIVFAHHVGKSAALNGQGDMQQASRGSSVLVDNPRWQSNLVGMTTKEAEALCDPDSGRAVGAANRQHFVRWGISKMNYGPPVAEKWFRRGSGGVLEPVTLECGKPKKACVLVNSGNGGDDDELW